MTIMRAIIVLKFMFVNNMANNNNNIGKYIALP